MPPVLNVLAWLNVLHLGVLGLKSLVHGSGDYYASLHSSLVSVKRLIIVQIVCRAADLVDLALRGQAGQDPWTSTFAAVLASSLSISFLAAYPRLVLLSLAVSTILNFLEACLFRPAGSHVTAGICGFAALVILFRFLREQNQLLRATEEVFEGQLIREKESAAEAGVAFDEKPIVYKGYAIHSTETWKEFQLVDFTVRVGRSSTAETCLTGPAAKNSGRA